jgi:hypothetical protein
MKSQVFKISNIIKKIILDSFYYLQMSLSQFFKTFDIEEIISNIPHFFNTKENHIYSGTGLPSLMYGYENMSVKERLKFKEWYDKNKPTNRFNMYEKII